MTGPSPARRRILIGAGCYADARAAIEIAERLAVSIGCDLGGLMLDDPAASEAAITPRQRIVTTSGALVIAPDRSQMRRVMAGDARAFRLHLSRIAESHALSWSFERQTGDLFGALVRAAQDWDVLMIGHRRLRRPRGPLLVVETGAAQMGDETAAFADTLALALRTRSIRVCGDEAAGLLDRIGRMQAALVVTDAASGPFHTGDQLRQLVEAARCPVLVLGAAGLRAAIAHDAHIPPAPGREG